MRTEYDGLSWFAALLIAVAIFLPGFLVGYCSAPIDAEVRVEDTIQIQDLDLTKENFFTVCRILEIKHPDVVYAQARLESGNFTSSHYRNRKNFLGIYDSKRKRYMSFDHWTDCLVAYRDKVQYRYKRNLDREDYLHWLVETGYAEDPNYISKLRKMLK
jgi:hypothetical protein